ncbi:hypothetical protein PoB_005702200 [Plakobranchus ocellatus]|uniref:Uncharacterized protein n=1 Tax=Plakobranchus ocellatus TaxID=259542 RepID=A0AAV4CGK6_9GAST|nr:hypothetical protein PoB_005702200 [Plakobranchus ocellatus]
MALKPRTLTHGSQTTDADTWLSDHGRCNMALRPQTLTHGSHTTDAATRLSDHGCWIMVLKPRTLQHVMLHSPVKSSSSTAFLLTDQRLSYPGASLALQLF